MLKVGWRILEVTASGVDGSSETIRAAFTAKGFLPPRLRHVDAGEGGASRRGSPLLPREIGEIATRLELAGFVRKPFDLDQLIATIRALCPA
jgi:hypothetical protein